MPSGAPATERRPAEVLDEVRDEDVVSVAPPVREVLPRVGPAPAARWRILAYKWFVLVHRTD
jgi:hypothetical protein